MKKSLLVIVLALGLVLLLGMNWASTLHSCWGGWNPFLVQKEGRRSSMSSASYSATGKG